VPIVSGRQLIGVLDIEADERRPLTERDREFLESLAAHIGGSLDRARLHAELARQAVTDQVTGLPNRRRFRAELDKVIAASGEQPASLLIVGVDGFKTVNDTYGDAAADDILRQVGQVLGARVRPPRFLARHTGDSFVILLPGVGGDEAVQIAEDLRIAVAMQLFTAAEQVEQATTSVGAATWPDEAHGANDLLAAAGHALYLAKQAGRNQVFQSNSALAALARPTGVSVICCGNPLGNPLAAGAGDGPAPAGPRRTRRAGRRLRRRDRAPDGHPRSGDRRPAHGRP
jgi:diguanylate cyclase (GGDEF)-like protein